MGNQSDFTKALQSATEHLWAHRKILRTVAVRIGFWPGTEGGAGGLVVSARPNLDKHGDAGLTAWRQEVVPFETLATIETAELIAVVDRVCQPSHDLIGTKAPGA